MSSPTPIRRLAIVNRGEAAMRCIRAVKALSALEGSGLRCIALYTEADRGAPFVRHADAALRLEVRGGSAVSAYLDREGLMSALARCEADAVWPGWGFVAEDAEFADRVAGAGLRFLGPPGDVMRAVGDKIGAKRLAESESVPVIPWNGSALESVEACVEAAARLGYPLMLKASAGGGGRGIRAVTSEPQLAAAFESARSEARNAFGDGRLFLERRLSGGRHVEVQIAADQHGTVVALGSRDCSVQRRHQKVIEEAPPPGLDAALVAQLEDCAVRLARRVGYVGVGTIEFLVADGSFAFLEVNPRLQVEHGITEERIGLDLVQLQIRIARGEPLPPVPSGRGCAIEARVCAEDPEADFLPSPGRIARFDPALGPRVRIDSGVATGCEVPPDFDSLIAKVIASGDTREEARARLATALADFELVVEGGATNKGFLIDLLETAVYREARFDTEWLDAHPELRLGTGEHAVDALVVAAVLSYQRTRDNARRTLLTDASHLSPSAIPASRGQRIDLSHGGLSYRLEVFAIGGWRYRVHLEGRVVQVTFRAEGPSRASLEIGRRTLRVLHDVSERSLRIEVEGRPYRFGNELAGQVRAGTPAMVVAIGVAAGDRVEAGLAIGRLEAMKMEIAFEAPVSGVVKEVVVRSGQQVVVGELLLSIEPDGAEAASATSRQLELPGEADPLDLFFTGETPDLRAADAASATARREAVEAARDEIRRVLMGYDVNPARCEKLAAVLEAPLPEGLSEGFRSELAEIRHELTLFADIEGLFSRAPRPAPSGEPGASHHAQLQEYVRRHRQGDATLTDGFRGVLLRALAHYGVADLKPGDALDRALLRILASQPAPELRRRLVLGCLRRIDALAGSGTHLGDDARLADALDRIAGLRGLVSDALADVALEAGYAIFEGPRLEGEAERTTKEVETWLAAAESALTPPPAAVLAHLSSAPRAVFDRVGRWLVEADPRRRAIAVAAHVRRFYAPNRTGVHTSGVVGTVHVERLDLIDGRIVLGSVARRGGLAPTLERLARAAEAAAVRREHGRVEAIELLVPVGDEAEVAAVRRELEPLVTDAIPSERLTLSLLPHDGQPRHTTWVHGPAGLRERAGFCGVHPEAAARIDLERLEGFDLERLESPDDIYCFHLRARDVEGDERLFVLADVRGRSPDEVDNGHEASLHVAAFERDFFESTRVLRNHLGIRDPRRRLQWNRIMLFAAPAIYLESELVERLARRLAPATRHLGLEKVVVRLNVLDRARPDRESTPVEIVIADPTGSRMELAWREPHHDALVPAQVYERKVVEARRRRLVYPYEIIRMLTGGGPGAVEISKNELPAGRFEEYDLDPAAAVPRAVSVGGRPYGTNRSAIVFGVIETPTEAVPEGMRRVIVLSDPTVGMGSLAAPECDRIAAAIDLAEELSLPVEWIPVSSGARIAMDSGTENLDATARVVRRIVTFTQAGGVIHVIVHGVNVGAQSYFDALATMLQHTRGALIMTPGSSMVLTGRAALEASGSVSAEDETAIGGFERVMGPNGEAQYYARNLVEAYALLYQHYRYSYVVPGEAGPRRLATSDPAERRVTDQRGESEEDGFETIGEIFDAATNLERKRPFAMRPLMRAVVDADQEPLERWRRWRGAETAIVWDASLGGHAVCLIGIESRNLPRGGDHPADGPASWTGGTLFPLSSKKVARALDGASGNRPAVVLANLSGFDGSPESMRKLQLEYGALIARAVVNFRGPLLFLVVSRYHGGAYVVFSRALNDGLRAAAVEGSFASVIGGGPAAAVVFSREARARTLRDPRIAALRQAAQASADPEARDAFDAALREVLLEKQSELALEFDAVHTVERARQVGSLEAIVEAEAIRPYLIGLLEGDRR